MRPQYVRAARLASIGEKDLALDRLEEAFEEREGFIILMNVDPRLDPLRGEPRFIGLLRTVAFGG